MTEQGNIFVQFDDNHFITIGFLKLSGQNFKFLRAYAELWQLECVEHAPKRIWKNQRVVFSCERIKNCSNLVVSEIQLGRNQPKLIQLSLQNIEDHSAGFGTI